MLGSHSNLLRPEAKMNNQDKEMRTTREGEILKEILGRDSSFLASDIARTEGVVRDRLRDSRILVIGAAGSIGSSFVREVSHYKPKGLHLLDISENNLVELVRDLRAGAYPLPEDFMTFALDFGGPEMAALLRTFDYEYVLNFSALKHVRSERDPFTLMRLLQVNVLANVDFIEGLKQTKSLRRCFSVSSDKSVRPANFMGASKALMERAFLAEADAVDFGSARFANVAFSDGSLLHGFGNRLQKMQPFSAPSDVRRYFITHQEAGQLCILGCFAGLNREIVFPKFDPDRDMMKFAEIARVYLRAHGYEPFECGSEEEALAFMKSRDSDSKDWACYFSESDTAGEKIYEEFSDPSEEVDMDRYETVGVITNPAFHGAEGVRQAIDRLKELRSSGEWSVTELKEVVQQAVPELTHVESVKNLDQKM